MDILIIFSSMKKRSKLEVEIRNLLSEVLLASLRDREMSVILYIIPRFCVLIKEKGGNRIRLRELLKHQGNISGLELNLERLSKRSNFLNIFEIDLENYVKLKSRFERHLSDICDKARLYRDFVSRLYSGELTFKSGIEGEIKKGILLFNEGFYFECHEFFEEIWKKERGDEKAFLKGLIHAAVAFYHLEYENYKGTIVYLMRSYKRLKEFEPVFLSVDVKTLLADLGNYLRRLEDSGTHNPEFLKSAVPRIGLIE